MIRQDGEHRVDGRLLLALAAALVAWPGRAGAADGEVQSRSSGTLSQELAGVELTPFSMALGHGDAARRSRFDAGPGGSLRLFRHRWAHLYLTPIQAGLFVSSVSDTFVAQLQTEGGVIVPGTARRLELGLGTGLAAALIDYSSRCEDLDCSIGGGVGWMVSVVARYLVVDRPDMTTGIGLRAIAFPQRPSDWWAGTIVLAAFDFAFGRPAGAPQRTSTSQPAPLPSRPAD